MYLLLDIPMSQGTSCNPVCDACAKGLNWHDQRPSWGGLTA